MTGSRLKYFLIAGFLLIQNIGYSQENTDGSYLFKIWLFIEKMNVVTLNSNSYPTKDSSLFNLFDKNIRILPDTIESKGFPDRYIFLSLGVKKTSVNNSNRGSKIIRGDSASYFFFPNECDEYIICIDKVSGLSYRLKGFRGNDFFSLMMEIKRQYRALYKENLDDKDFFSLYKVEGLDFRCIYEGLKSFNFQSDKYECLKPCEYHIRTIH